MGTTEQMPQDVKQMLRISRAKFRKRKIISRKNDEHLVGNIFRQRIVQWAQVHMEASPVPPYNFYGILVLKF